MFQREIDRRCEESLRRSRERRVHEQEHLLDGVTWRDLVAVVALAIGLVVALYSWGLLS